MRARLRGLVELLRVRLGPHARRRPFRTAALALAAIGVVVIGTWTIRYSARIIRLKGGVGDVIFYTGDGRPWFRLDEQHQNVPLARISPLLQQAVVAVEDHRFYHHPGLDPIALGRALTRNVASRDVVQGGSTITQQLARTLFLSNNRTMGRKVEEAALSVLLEIFLSKRQILELYLNRVYLGGDIYGVEAMARKALRKPSRDLTLGEAALVAGIIQAPNAYSPWSHLDLARRRQATVLQRMREEGYIAAADEARARTASLRIAPHPGSVPVEGGYAKDYLRQQFRNQFGGDNPPDWTVTTTFVPEVQAAAEAAVRNGLRRLRIPGLQAALVAIDPATGNILAMVGGNDSRDTPFNRAVRSRRQPGSAFKPFVYATALEHGYTPVSVLKGLTSVTVPAEGDAEWTPRDASGRAEDELTIREALLASNNPAAVEMQQQVGTRAVLRLADDLGVPDLPDVPSLALGSGLVSPLELTAAFAAFPGGGQSVRPRGLVEVRDADRAVVFRQHVERRRVLSPQTAFQMVSLLRDVVDRGTATAARRYGVRGAVAGKTGTTNDGKDAWFVGFSSSVVAGVWVGFDQPAPIGRNATGARIALPIWSDFMRRTARRLPATTFARPEGLEDQDLCRVSYLRPVEGCPTYVEYFKPDDPVPSELCPIHKGTLRQTAERAIQGFFSALGKRIKGIFR